MNCWIPCRTSSILLIGSKQPSYAFRFVKRIVRHGMDKEIIQLAAGIDYLENKKTYFLDWLFERFREKLIRNPERFTK